MQTIFTFISAFLWILPIIMKQILGNFDFADPGFLSAYFIITSIIFIALTLFNVVTFFIKKAPESIRYLAILSVFVLIGFVQEFSSSYYGYLGFLGFLAFIAYKK